MYPKPFLLCMAALAGPLLALPIEEVSANTTELAARQFGGGGLAINCPHDKLLGPSKRTAVQNSQVTANLECAQNECSLADINEHTFGYTVGGGASFDWTAGIAAEFSIVQEWTSGGQFTCNGEPHDTICVWSRLEYSVFDADTSSDACNNAGTVEVKAPKKEGQNYYCVVGKQYCRSDGQGYWDPE
ncbi:MAG: hypothetical protein Q9218_001285 [Villophora microphyllina]